MTESSPERSIVATFYSVEEAELARIHLAAVGIRAFMDGKHAVGVLPMYARIFGGVRLVVDERDLAAAREVLAGANGDAPATDDAGAVEQKDAPVWWGLAW